ncbi:FAD-dependent oxidoreductase [Klebsiella pneumoniae subsp. pneumoniae]|nr:FAD-dependent oxidoreductase [Klebsiella pneumoniae subsp. pneumoniae]
MKNSRKRRKEAVATRRLVVIGNGMAATRLVQRLVERDPARFAITVVGDEPHPAYNRIQLSPLLAGEKTAAQIPLLPAEWYTRHGVCLRSGEAVDEVDIQQRRLRIAETWLPWDELVFATGSRPAIPPLPGIDRPQVMPLPHLGGRGTYSGDTRPGGGDWRRGAGVEAAAALRRHGGEVTLLHRGSGLMAPLTDAFAADELRQQLEARGIRCVLECRIAAHRRRWRAAGGRARIPAPPEWCWLPACSPTAVWRRSPACCASGGSWSTVRWPPLAAGDQRHRRMLRN